MTLPLHPAWTPLTRPSSWVFRWLVAIRNASYDRGIGVRRSPIPVISIGNLAVGGTGKTPFVARTVTLLRELGARPAVVSRGYGGSAGRGPVRVRSHDGGHGGAHLVGDEPWMLAARFSDLPVIVGSDRRAGVAAAAEGGANVAVLDDGFQHRRLERVLDVVVLPARSPLGNGRLLPAGPLREPVSSLRRAQIVVRVGTTSDPVEDIPGAPKPRIGTFHAVRRSSGFAVPGGGDAPAPDRAVAFCGIGHPESFRAVVESTGVDIVEFVAFRDHHPFRESDLRPLLELARRHDVPLLTTEKDIARLDSDSLAASIRERLLCLRMDLAVEHEDALRRALLVALGNGEGR